MRVFRFTCLAFGFTAFSAAAHAQIVVLGKNDAAKCYELTLRGNTGSTSAIETCSDALTENLVLKNKTATFVNRGILYMRAEKYNLASQDYKAAIALKADLAEAYVNYGAALIMQDKYNEALKKLNLALENSDSPARPEALLNRAIVFDHQENYKAAYYDLKEALALRPDWGPALTLIGRYEVRKAG